MHTQNDPCRGQGICTSGTEPWPVLVQIKAFRVFGAKTLSEPMLTCQLDAREQNYVKFWFKKMQNFLFKKMYRKMLQNISWSQCVNPLNAGYHSILWDLHMVITNGTCRWPCTYWYQAISRCWTDSKIYYVLFICPLAIDYYYTAAQRSWSGVYWFHLVRLSICGQNRVRSVSSTILAWSISYLHTLSSNFRRCVTCESFFQN